MNLSSLKCNSMPQIRMCNVNATAGMNAGLNCEKLMNTNIVGLDKVSFSHTKANNVKTDCVAG